MRTGALIFAFNNQQIDYVSMAAWSAERIHRHLGIPVCVVTDAEIPADTNVFDHVVQLESSDTQLRHFSDFQTQAVWHNSSRVTAYDLSPWDQTLVLDADYVVASNQLAMLFKNHNEFMSHKTAIEVSGNYSFEDNNRFGQVKFPMLWATVMLFKKNTTSKLIFDSMKMIKQNWDHYRNVYKVTEKTYRNDFALSIASNLVQGHTLWSTDIPWKLITVTPDSQLTQCDQDQFRVDYKDSQGRARWITLSQDFHAMGKQSLERIIAND
jgi:hypothetical protein